MCGVIGFWSDDPQPEHREILKNLFVESKVRGMHAYGYAKVDHFGWAVRKSATLMSVLDDLENEAPFTGLIGHTRYSTSGDWKDENNNQPIVWGNLPMVLNGVITMKPKADYELEYAMEFSTANDTEVFAWMTAERHDGPAKLERWKRILRGHQSIAAAWIEEGRVNAIRNHRRPLWITFHQGATFLASTTDILKRSGLPPGSLLSENTLYRLTSPT